MSNEPKYLTIARGDIGLREIKGPKHSSRIAGWLKKLGAWWQDDETPWCGVAVAGWLAEAGLPYPKTYYRALSWAEYGVACKSPKLGAIAVLQRKGGGHVGIVTGVNESGSHVRLLGGNQGDSVCEAWFEASRIVAYRMPEATIIAAAPVATVGKLSESEA